MNPTDPLAQLKDIHLPPPVSAWPPAPGWWIAAMLLLAIAIIAIWKFIATRRRRAYRRAALQALQINYAQWQREKNDVEFQMRVNQLLKQTALTVYPAPQVAALHGDAWLQFLDAQLSRPLFANSALAVIGDQYRVDSTAVAGDELFAAAKLWIRKHRC